MESGQYREAVEDPDLWVGFLVGDVRLSIQRKDALHDCERHSVRAIVSPEPVDN
jgi:hypothetical protein